MSNTTKPTRRKVCVWKFANGHPTDYWRPGCFNKFIQVFNLEGNWVEDWTFCPSCGGRIRRVG